MSQRKRTFALLLSAAVILFLLASSAFIAIHADHDCIGEGCEICEMLCVCVERFQQFAVAVVLLVLAAAVSALFRVCAGDAALFRTSRTLVTLKVKLSD